MNVVMLVGRVGQDPEIRYLDSGRAIVSFSMAVANGGKRDETCWLNCEAWQNDQGKGAGSVIINYVRKGHMLSIQGSMKQENWVDRDTGKNRSKHIVSVQNVTLINAKENEPDADADDDDFVAPLPAKAKGETKVTAKKKSYESTASKGKYANGSEAKGDDWTEDEIPY